MITPLTVEQQWQEFRAQAMPFLTMMIKYTPTEELQRDLEKHAKLFFYAGAGAHDKVMRSAQHIPKDDIGPYLDGESNKIVDSVMTLATTIIMEAKKMN